MKNYLIAKSRRIRSTPYTSRWEKSQSFKIEINGDTFSGKVCDLPLI